VTAADGENPAQTVQQQLTLTVHAAPLVITTKTLPAATAGTAYSQQLTATGGTGRYTWTLASGTLPAGLALSASGTIAGTPAGSGTSTFTVQAADGENPAQTVLQQFTLTVHAAPVVITTRSLPNLAADRAYSQQLRAAGGTGPYTWVLASGRLPAGITLSREGSLRGEPWAAGTYAFTVRATDSQWPAKSVTQRLSITVTGEKADLAVSVTGPSSAKPGSRVTYTVTVKDNGPAWASMVSVSLDTAGLTDVKASDAGQVKLTESRDTAQASAAWYAAGIAPGQTLTFTVTGTVPAKGLIDVSAVGQIQSPTSDPNPRNNTSTVTTRSAKPVRQGPGPAR
jgi:large repetitive protein